MDISDTIVCQDILALLKRFKATMAEVAESHNLTPIQLGALHAIHEGYVTMGKVAQTMHCDASNVTGIIDRLVVMRLVLRQEDSRDRRVKTLALTAKGHKIITQISASLPDTLGCANLTAKERVTIHNVLVKLAV